MCWVAFYLRYSITLREGVVSAFVTPLQFRTAYSVQPLCGLAGMMIPSGYVWVRDMSVSSLKPRI